MDCFGLVADDLRLIATQIAVVTHIDAIRLLDLPLTDFSQWYDAAQRYYDSVNSHG